MIKSPCKGLCKLDKEKVCQGCQRTLEEIRNWRNYSDEEKLVILARLNGEHDERAETEVCDRASDPECVA